MLDELVRDLARDGVCLLLARDTGLVRDVVRITSKDPSFQHVYPSVQAAVDAAQRRAR